LRILIANVTLATRTGTETAVRDLAIGLKAAGQQPMVYSTDHGQIAEEICSSGIPVLSNLSQIGEPPDIVHGNHHVETVTALLQCPNARGLFVCHDRLAHMSVPPRMGRIRIHRYVAVDYRCLERLIQEYRIPEGLTRVLYNSVDTRRFARRGPLPERPRRGLIFSNNAKPGTHLDAVAEACRSLKLPLDVIGSGVGNSCPAPEGVLGCYDIVFAKARCALEAMAVGSSVVLCDAAGLGQMVTMSTVEELRRWNFGKRTLCEPLDPAEVVRQVERYDPNDAAAVSDYIRQRANVTASVDEYLRLYAEIMSEPLTKSGTAAQELNEYVWHLATRVHELEAELIEYKRPYRMEPMSDAACKLVSLVVERCPARVSCNTTMGLWVEVENGRSSSLGSFPPCPVYLSYRWFSAASGEVVVPEGSRTPLRPSIAPGMKETYFIRVAAPDVPGMYQLRVTLVQEGVRWLYTCARPVAADALISAVAATDAAAQT
jgi:Glycosyltransferase Family 4